MTDQPVEPESEEIEVEEPDPMDGFVPEPGVGEYGDVEEQDSADD